MTPPVEHEFPYEEDPSSLLPQDVFDLVVDILDGSDAAAKEAELEALCAERPAWKSSILRIVATASSASDPERFEAPSSHRDEIGPYRVLSVVGQGSYGTVYHVERDHPIRTQLALKVLRVIGLDSQGSHLALHRERHVLEAMNHEAIARVVGGGTTEDGFPYIAMELVRGGPITDYCDQRDLDLSSRVKLLSQVCRGVHHAHQKGVIHRDLKPGNILVTEEGDGLQPKIIDFGLARLVTGKDSGASSLGFAGTPLYMAPEQATFDGRAVDTRTDVYALGTILYELVVGHPPFSGSRVSEVLANIKATSPMRPSQAAPVHRQRALRTDLDWIAAKALAKDKDDRYDSALDLGRDLDRFVAGQAVLAGPPTWTYRVRKIVSRHKGKVVATASLAAVLIGATLISSNQWMKAKASASALEARNQEFALLQLVDQLHDLQQQAATFSPPRLNNTESARNWLEAWKHLEQQRPAVAAAIQRLDARTEQLSEASYEQQLARHPQYPELRRLRAGVSAAKAADVIRDGQGQVAEPSLTWQGHGGLGLGILLQTGYQLVKPDRKNFGHEALGLSLIRRARELAGDPATQALAGLRLAQSYHATGQDEAARAALADAVALQPTFPEDLQKEVAGITASLNDPQAIANQRAKTSRALRNRMVVKGFPPTENASRRLYASLNRFLEDLDRASKVLPAEVRGGIEWAKQVDQLSISYEPLWHRARSAIAKADGQVAHRAYANFPIDLQPQVGLVPIGMNPATRLWEFYHLRSACDWSNREPPARVPVPEHRSTTGDIPVTKDTGIVFVLVPGGSFLMGAQRSAPGSPNYDPQAMRAEGPTHRVSLRPFFIARHELTQAQWARLSDGDNPSTLRPGAKPGGKANPTPVTWAHPVESVSLADCTALARRHGLQVPTEAQWEYACRAGTTTRWTTGQRKESLIGAVNLADSATLPHTKGARPIEAWLNDGFLVHAPVDAGSPNAWGLHYVHGNVCEMCRDRLGVYILPILGLDGQRLGMDYDSFVARGGAFRGHVKTCRSSTRVPNSWQTRLVDFGVRLVRELDRL